MVLAIACIPFSSSSSTRHNFGKCVGNLRGGTSKGLHCHRRRPSHRVGSFGGIGTSHQNPAHHLTGTHSRSLSLRSVDCEHLFVSIMDFCGFSSSEDEESGSLPPPPPLPPDPITPRENLTLSDTSPQSSKSSHGGIRGGGRPAATLPEGCKSFFTEVGVKNYACSCERIFLEKKNLIRHFEQSCGMRTPVIKASKRRRILSFSENNETPSASDLDQVCEVADSFPVTVFNEDEEGVKLLQCE